MSPALAGFHHEAPCRLQVQSGRGEERGAMATESAHMPGKRRRPRATGTGRGPSARVSLWVLMISGGERVAEQEYHETDDLDYDAGDFWVHLESSAVPELATEENGAIWDRSLHVSTSGNVANGTMLTTLLFAYIGFHVRLLENHQCSNPDCRLVWVHRQLRDMLETALEQTAHLLEGCDEEPEFDEEEETEETND